MEKQERSSIGLQSFKINDGNGKYPIIYSVSYTSRRFFCYTKNIDISWWIFQWRPPSPQQKDVRLGRWKGGQNLNLIRQKPTCWQRPRFYGLLLFFWLSQVGSAKKNMDAWCFFVEVVYSWLPKKMVGGFLLSPFLYDTRYKFHHFSDCFSGSHVFFHRCSL